MIDPVKEIERLRKEIQRHDYLYYAEAKPEISDQEYDRLFHDLKELETKHPELVTFDSPTQRVGESLTKGFKSVRHPFPLRSLDNSYNEVDLLDFNRRVNEGLDGEKPEYVCELKFDGVSVLLHYENGKFAGGSTRGDGNNGDDVSANLKTIKSLPLTLAFSNPSSDIPNDFYVRGEVFMKLADFNAFNDLRLIAGETMFANPRNTVAGSLKLLDPAVVARRPLSIVCYGVEVAQGIQPATQSDGTTLLRDLGIPVSQYLRMVDSIEGVIDYWREWEARRDELPFEIDGIVVKVNSYAQQKTLGMTARAPRWAMACKFSARQAKTVLKDIILQIGRTGILTPVAELEPIPLGGVTVKRATLHNFDEIERLGIRVGDMILLERGGDVIPKVTGFVPEFRPHNAKKFNPPKKCPFCDTPLVKEEGEVALRCPNPEDREVVKRQIEHFASRGALDIDGLGSETVVQLVDKNIVSDPGDLFKLELEQITLLEGFAQKSAQKLLDGLEAAKSKPLEKLIFALGIRHVGQTTARSLAIRFGSIDALKTASTEELQAIPDIGPNVALAIVEFFFSNYGNRILEKLRRAGFVFESKDSKPIGNKFAGLTFVITGTLSSMTREEAERAIIAQGGKPSGSVSKKTSFVIVGENPGSKADKAAQLGVRTLTEEEFKELITD